MSPYKVNKTIAEINEKIRKGKAVIVTAEEIISIVEEKGPVRAALEVDVVTTGTFGPMCSSGAFMNFGHSQPRIKAAKAWLNEVPVFAGIAAVDVYIGVTEPAEDDPLNKVYPGGLLLGEVGCHGDGHRGLLGITLWHIPIFIERLAFS